MDDVCEVSGLSYQRVPGGRIYEVNWQYDFDGYSPSLVGVNHVFVPEPISEEAPDTPFLCKDGERIVDSLPDGSFRIETRGGQRKRVWPVERGKE